MRDTKVIARRQFLKAAVGGAAWAATGNPLARLAAAATKGHDMPPNIVLIMADDMGFSDIGCYGGEVRTPNLDRLAAGGVRFTQFYNTARCCPTRASLLTGLHPHQAGVGHMTGDYHLPGYRGRLSDRCVTIAEALKQAGYVTLMSGKWHVGDNPKYWPRQRGFDEYYGLISGASSYWRLTPGRVMARNDEQIKPEGEDFYMTDAFTDYALTFLDRHGQGEKPFFLYLAYTAPHWPLHAWPEDTAKYKGVYEPGWEVIRAERHKRMIEMGIIDERWKLSDRHAPEWDTFERKEDMALRMAVYAAQIDRMDQGIGKVLTKLRRIGAQENTLVMFLSDNGGCAETVNRGAKGVPPGEADSFLSYLRPWANVSNTPFRKYKHWVHEGGISTPLIAHLPGVAKAGAITHETGHIADIMATCLDVADAEYPKHRNGRPVSPLEGKSLLPVIKGSRREGHESLCFEHEGNRAVRAGKWKLVAQHREQWRLYDMEADRTETTPVTEKHPDKVAELSETYDRWARRSMVVEWDKLQEYRKRRSKRG